jgi:D-glycero-D-manno-heptose 1,7-bisphosphate phosphatase
MRLVILDRDGVINRGSLEAIARLCRADYKVVVVTNQSGVARGLFSVDKLNKIHVHMLERVRQKGGQLDAIFFCPHGPDDECPCRKPKPGMFLDLAGRLKVNLTAVPAVGDSLRDLQAARAVHALPVLVRTGKGNLTRDCLRHSDLANTAVYEDLSTFVDSLLDGELDERVNMLLQGTESRDT